MYPFTKPNVLVGNPVLRVEDLRFLKGAGTYVGDLNRPGQWHAAVLRSSFGHGRILGIDVSAALAKPGVHAVLTAKDLPHPLPTIRFRRPNPTIAPYGQPVIAEDFVRYHGEPVALVLADSAERAEDALSSIEVNIESLPAVLDAEDAFKGGVLLFQKTDTNCATTFTVVKGDTDAAFAAAHYRRRERFHVSRVTAMPMETRGLLAEWDEAKQYLTIAGAAKLPFFNRKAMASMMELPESQVDYIEYDVGGGFGARGEFYPEDYLVAFAARSFKRPVKWIEDRREHFMATGHSRESDCEIEIAMDAKGVLMGLRATVYANIGAYMRPNGTTPVRNSAHFLQGPYHVPNIDIKAHAIVTNKTPSGTYRGPGRYEGSFYSERMMDIAAREMDIDALEIRRRNFVVPEQMPYKLPPLEPNDGFGSTQYDSGNYADAFEQCIEAAGWAKKIAAQGRLIDGRYHGFGVGAFIEGGGSGPKETAKMVVEKDGSVSVYVGSSSIGQGVETVFAQVAADALEIPMSRIRVLHGSTNYLAEGWGSYGSRATVMGGSAVLLTAQSLLTELRAAAAKKLAVAPEALSISEGEAKAPDGRRVGLGDVAGLSVDGAFVNSKATYTYGTAIAHVAVDPETGHVEVVDYTVVDDVGRIINPLTLHGQVLGAAVQGLGGTFSEEILYDANGQLLVASLADYLVPVATDYKSLHCISLENSPSPNNPLGAKGAGEGGIIPVGGVLANAVSNALSSLGVAIREVPITPAKLWAMIQAKQNAV